MFDYHEGSTALLINVPHCGTHLPETLAATMTAEARELTDTDWHVDRLYGFARALGASLLSARYSRYVIDLNRPPDDACLYPGQHGTGLCPTQTFAGAKLYEDACVINSDQRLAEYWLPYHEKLRTCLDVISKTHGFAVLFDAHSICSRVPSLFAGQLPDFNLGTNEGASCDPTLKSLALDSLTSENFTLVADARFKGGYITRHYGEPVNNVHALQLELAQCTYMNEAPPFSYLPDLASTLIDQLRGLITQLSKWSP